MGFFGKAKEKISSAARDYKEKAAVAEERRNEYLVKKAERLNARAAAEEKYNQAKSRLSKVRTPKKKKVVQNNSIFDSGGFSVGNSGGSSTYSNMSIGMQPPKKRRRR